MPVYRLGDKRPQIPSSAYIAAEATVIGQVTLGEHVSVWPGAVIRADNDTIRIGNDSNVQEGAVLHADPGFPLNIAGKVTIGHQAMVHGCTIGEGTLVGIQAVVMNGAVIGAHSIVGAGSLVPEGKQFPERSLIMGIPGKVVRQVTDEDLARNLRAAEGYSKKAQLYPEQLVRID